MTIARAKDGNGWICPRCTRLGRPKCECNREQTQFAAASSVAEQFRQSQRRERRRTLFLVLFVILVICAGAWFGSTPS